jgi:hypothetical protein
LSVFLGIISDVNFLHIFLRAIVFGIVFFGLGFGLRFIITSFFPELLFADGDSPQPAESPGAIINITLDSSGEYAVPELYKSSGDSMELGNIDDLISGVFKSRNESDDIEMNKKGAFTPIMNEVGIDTGREAGYNDVGGIRDESVFEKPPAERSVFTPSFGDDSGLGGLPDLDMMARAFSSASNSMEDPASILAPMPAAAVSESMISSATSIESMPLGSVMPLSEDLGYEPAKPRYAGNKPQTLNGDFDPKSLAEGIRTVLSKEK